MNCSIQIPNLPETHTANFIWFNSASHSLGWDTVQQQWLNTVNNLESIASTTLSEDVLSED